MFLLCSYLQSPCLISKTWRLRFMQRSIFVSLIKGKGRVMIQIPNHFLSDLTYRESIKEQKEERMRRADTIFVVEERLGEALRVLAMTDGVSIYDAEYIENGSGMYAITFEIGHGDILLDCETQAIVDRVKKKFKSDTISGTRGIIFMDAIREYIDEWYKLP